VIARTQPLVVAWLATLIVTAAARYAPGLHLSDEQALYVAGGLFTVATAIVHRYVTPTARPRAADGAPLVPAGQVAHTEATGYPPAEPPSPSRIADERPEPERRPRRPPPDPGRSR
jgi:hypothetical protein